MNRQTQEQQDNSDIMQYRQGDILLMKVAEKPTGEALSRESGRVVLAHGEATGHSHTVTDEQASLYAVGVDGRLLVLGQDADLTHEEHDTIRLPKGTYRVIRQREYAPAKYDLQGSRWVAD